LFDKITFDAKTFDFVALILQAVSGVLSSAGVLSKLSQKFLTGTVTLAGALAASRIVIKAITGVLTSSGTLTRSIWKSFAGSITSTGAISKLPQLMLSGVLTSVGALVAIRIVSKVITGVLDFAGALGAIRMRIVWRRQLKDFVGRELKDFTGRDIK